MSFEEVFKWYFVPWKKFATFRGRARRREFWTFFLINIAIVVLLSQINEDLASIFTLVAYIPSMAVIARRMHDIGQTGWTALLLLLGAAKLGQYGEYYEPALWLALALLAVFVLLATLDSQKGENRFGPNPKEAHDQFLG